MLSGRIKTTQLLFEKIVNNSILLCTVVSIIINLFYAEVMNIKTCSLFVQITQKTTDQTTTMINKVTLSFKVETQKAVIYRALYLK